MRGKIMPESTITMSALKIIVLTSIVFVWFVRYDNIVQEFKHYNYPHWLRDLVGILKVSFAVMLQSDTVHLAQVGCIGIAILMSAALLTHLKLKNHFGKMLPSLTLFSCSLLIFFNV